MNQLQEVQCVAFEAMSLERQMEALQQDGVYIGKRKLSQGTKLLYQWHSIYIEITYSKHRNEVQNVYCFTNTSILDQYLPASDVDEKEK
jgi:hypothetical protein